MSQTCNWFLNLILTINLIIMDTTGTIIDTKGTTGTMGTIEVSDTIIGEIKITGNLVISPKTFVGIVTGKDIWKTFVGKNILTRNHHHEGFVIGQDTMRPCAERIHRMIMDIQLYQECDSGRIRSRWLLTYGLEIQVNPHTSQEIYTP